MKRPKLIDPPDRIWLQVGDIQRDATLAECQDEMTWHTEPIFDTDIEYRLVRRQTRPRPAPPSRGGERE